MVTLTMTMFIMRIMMMVVVIMMLTFIPLVEKSKLEPIIVCNYDVYSLERWRHYCAV